MKTDKPKLPISFAITAARYSRVSQHWIIKKTANLLRKHGGKTSEELKAEGK
jgi:hypothetical protein